MTESPQQPGYNAAQQQQAAAYAAQQQQAYAAQQQYAAAQASTVFDKLPMNMLTVGLAAGGLVALLLGVLLGELKHASILSYGTSILNSIVALMVVTAVAITTGPKYRNTYRAIAVAFAVLSVGSIIGSMLDEGTLEPEDVVVKIGAGLVLVALCLFAAATFTMAEANPHAAAAQQQAALQAAQQQAAAQQAAQQQQQYAATQQHQEQQTTWQQQQPPQQ